MNNMTPTNVVEMTPQNTLPQKGKKAKPALPPLPDIPTTVAKGSVIGPQHDIPADVDQLLVDILVFPRGLMTLTELEFQSWLLRKLNSMNVLPVKRQMDVLTVEIPHPATENRPERPSTTLFSCHTDSVDPAVAASLRKKLTYDPTFGDIALDKESCGSSLGADDGVGVWIMLKMIEARVPGGYIFHRGEECGGLSAKAMAQHEKAWIGKFDVSVAFDRPRTSEVITHQRGGRECASNKFAEAVCLALNAKGMDYVTSKTGVYTDNYEYRGLIAENINIGVGYEGQHGRTETLDYAHAFTLMNAALKVNWDAMPVDRDPSAADPEPSYDGYDYTKSSWYRNYRKGQLGLGMDGYDDFDRFEKVKPTKPAKFKGQTPKKDEPVVPALDESRWLVSDALDMTSGDMLWTCQEEPDEAHAMMVALVREVSRLRADVEQMRKLLGDV